MVYEKKNVENTEWQVSSISDVTVYIKDSGTDTSTTRYLGMNEFAKNLELRNDQTIQISEINGKVLKQPMTIYANTGWKHTHRTKYRVSSFKIKVLVANTNLKLIVKCNFLKVMIFCSISL